MIMSAQYYSEQLKLCQYTKHPNFPRGLLNGKNGELSADMDVGVKSVYKRRLITVKTSKRLNRLLDLGSGEY
jgi:hypothetical protein